MQLRDKLVSELVILVNVERSYQRLVLSLHQQYIADENPDSLAAYIQANFELGKRTAVIEFIKRMLLIEEVDE